ncbi:hypothetical protein D3C75_685660 [compost metagenome]
MGQITVRDHLAAGTENPLRRRPVGEQHLGARNQIGCCNGKGQSQLADPPAAKHLLQKLGQAFAADQPRQGALGSEPPAGQAGVIHIHQLGAESGRQLRQLPAGCAASQHRRCQCPGAGAGNRLHGNALLLQRPDHSGVAAARHPSAAQRQCYTALLIPAHRHPPFPRNNFSYRVPGLHGLYRNKCV